jgi:hypothetical protein
MIACTGILYCHGLLAYGVVEHLSRVKNIRLVALHASVVKLPSL